MYNILNFFLKSVSGRKKSPLVFLERKTGIIPFSVMLEQNLNKSYSGDFVYHGSNIYLEPGKDFILPRPNWGDENVVCAAGLNTALRFSMVRKYGIDQLEGTDIYSFITDKYRIIILNAHFCLSDFKEILDDTPSYIYELPASCFDNLLSRQPVPIISASKISKNILISSGFSFIRDDHRKSIKRFFPMNNDNSTIEREVLSGNNFMKKQCFEINRQK